MSVRYFLQAILDNPTDDAPRLAYAAWFEERGDPRGEFIRIECELPHIDAEDPRCFDLCKRHSQLHRKHRTKWLRQLQLVGNSNNFVFKRGFIEELNISGEKFLQHREMLFQQAALQHLWLDFEHPSETVPLINNCKELSWIKTIRLFMDITQGGHEVRKLAESRRILERLVDLNVFGVNPGTEMDPVVLQELVASPCLVQLEHLDLTRTFSAESCVAVLTGSPKTLKTLDLRENPFGDEGARILASSSGLRGLETLVLGHCNIGSSGAEALAASSFYPNLKILALWHNPIDDVGARALAAWLDSNSSRTISLINCNISESMQRELEDSYGDRATLFDDE